jgi:hypothetical protein
MDARLGLVLALVLGGSGLSACKEDPPPPPLPPPSTAATAQERAAAASGSQVPSYEPETLKRYRAELCFYGAWGLKITRDAYLKSLDGKEPSVDRLPSFGDFAELEANAAAATSATAAATAAPSGKPAPSAKASATASIPERAPLVDRPALDRMPFVKYLGACSSLNRKEEHKPEDAVFDAAIAEFEPWASALSKQLDTAQRYYVAKQHERDKVERGKTMHKDLLKTFAEIDGRFAAFGKAFHTWQAGLGKSKEKLDKAGELSVALMAKARALTALAIAEPPAVAALETARGELAAARDALVTAGKEDPKAVHPAEVVPQCAKLLEASAQLERAVRDKKPLTTSLYLVHMQIASLVEANHRALGQYLRTSGQTKSSDPLPTMKPQIDVVHPRPDIGVRDVPVMPR